MFLFYRWSPVESWGAHVSRADIGIMFGHHSFFARGIKPFYRGASGEGQKAGRTMKSDVLLLAISPASQLLKVGHHSLRHHLYIAFATPMSIEFQWTHTARNSARLRVSTSVLWQQLSDKRADSLDKLHSPFKSELALNTERRKCLLGNLTNQGMGKAEKLIDLFPFCVSFLIRKLKVERASW